MSFQPTLYEPHIRSHPAARRDMLKSAQKTHLIRPRENRRRDGRRAIYARSAVQIDTLPGLETLRNHSHSLVHSRLHGAFVKVFYGDPNHIEPFGDHMLPHQTPTQTETLKIAIRLQIYDGVDLVDRYQLRDMFRATGARSEEQPMIKSTKT
tara:strand:+ start:743 stop:1198 length:456 start_codon:yes stop_codon:yes gene_type:complete